jgi:hypothetical protein
LLAGVRAENGTSVNALLWTCLLGAGGALSVWWWYVTEQAGQGDLRFYLLLQALPLVLIPLWHAIYRAPHNVRIAFGGAVVLYGIAKAAELSDHALFAALVWISGHTVKHLMAVLAAGLLVNHLVKRVEIQPHAIDPIDPGISIHNDLARLVEDAHWSERANRCHSNIDAA